MSRGGGTTRAPLGASVVPPGLLRKIGTEFVTEVVSSFTTRKRFIQKFIIIKIA